MKPDLAAAALCLALTSCTSSRGTPVELSFGEPAVTAAGGASNGGTGGSTSPATSATTTAAGGTASGAAGEPGVVFGPPTVDRFTPSTGPWGTSVTIDGADLGDGSRFASLDVGAALTLTPDADAVERWTENQVVFRVPFPHEGVVTLETDEGAVEAGSFTPSHEVLGTLSIEVDTDVLASVSLGSGSVALALGGTPLGVVVFDGDEWIHTEVSTEDVRPETFRLHADSAGELAAFALSTASPPELIAFEPAGDEWQAAPTGLLVTEDTLVAGGPDGASAWFATADGWQRARPTDGVWQLDKGPIADPYASSMLPTAGATSDGALWVARARDTGSTFNDKGAPFMRQLAPDATAFGSEFQMGNDLDDYLTSVSIVDRGRGLLVEYCGSDENLLGGPDDYECLTAGVIEDATAFRNIGAESSTVRHAFTNATRHSVTCQSSEGTQLDGETWAWPCLSVEALEADPAGALVPVFRHDGQLVVLGRR
ncbi:MAG TPA: IPT/TIG domain-containing protein [Polyangiaceae bacterium]|nr:IPT/TIG domain-containing protein [Polyangiaceae bacterium]